MRRRVPSLTTIVPNVPCGVERIGKLSSYPLWTAFLMYRVELKEHLQKWAYSTHHLFLMYRVELKGGGNIEMERALLRVPNVPCGVESQFS